MLARVRSLLALASVSRGEQALRASSIAARFSSLSRDVAEANRELDEFFGVSGSNPSGSGRTSPAASTSCHIEEGDDLNPERRLMAHGDGSSRRAAAETLAPGWGASPAYGFASSVEQTHHAASVQPPPPLPTPPSPPLSTPVLTHIDSSGSASMVDVSQKAVTVREAQASCVVWLGQAYELVAANAVSKGDVLRVAQLAGVCGAKATASLIPLCHNIPISKVDVQLHLDQACRTVVVRALARTDGKTGVEMEALTAASVAALTVYDMCKAAAKDMVVGQLQLDYKSGGRSGTYLRAGLSRADLLPSARPPL